MFYDNSTSSRHAGSIKHTVKNLPKGNYVVNCMYSGSDIGYSTPPTISGGSAVFTNVVTTTTNVYAGSALVTLENDGDLTVEKAIAGWCSKYYVVIYG